MIYWLPLFLLTEIQKFLFAKYELYKINIFIHS